MANAEGLNPKRHEVERQLERMLAHPLFEARPKQAKIFKYLVTSSLEGNAVSEQAILDEFFTDKRYAEDTTSVRTNVSIIRRELLERYYGEDGKDDPVIITLPAPERTQMPGGKYKIIKRPPGEAYSPEFRYNPRSEIAREFALAHHLLRGTPSQITDALLHLAKVNEMEPDQPDMILAAVEAIAVKMLLGEYADEREKYLEGAFGAIARIEPAVPDYWRMHAVRGLLHSSASDFDSAKQEFAAALALDRESTRNSNWYTFFLFRTGQEEEAIEIEAGKAVEGIDNAGTHAAHGILLCHARRFEEAERALSQALELDRNSWQANYGMTLLYSETGRHYLAREQSKRLASLLESDDSEILLRRLGLERHE